LKVSRAVQNSRPRCGNTEKYFELLPILEAGDPLLPLKTQISGDDARAKAQLVLAKWFEHVSDIELADREAYTVETEMLECEKWDNGKPKRCRIRFFLQPRA
jgi:hypothetical protein